MTKVLLKAGTRLNLLRDEVYGITLLRDTEVWQKRDSSTVIHTEPGWKKTDNRWVIAGYAPL